MLVEIAFIILLDINFFILGIQVQRDNKVKLFNAFICAFMIAVSIFGIVTK